MIPWLDPVATEVLLAARKQYAAMELNIQSMVESGTEVSLYFWCGDRVQNTVAALLRRRGLAAENCGICLTIERTTPSVVAQAIREIVAEPAPCPAELMNRTELQRTEKWDWVLPDRLFFANYAAGRLDLAGAIEVCAELAEQIAGKTPL